MGRLRKELTLFSLFFSPMLRLSCSYFPRRFRGERSLMKRSSQVLFYLLAVLMFISMFRLFSEPPTEDVPYSTFKTLLTEKKVKDLVITRDHIRGVRVPDKEGEKEKPFTVVRVDDNGLVKDLDASGIAYRGEISENWLRTSC